MSTSMSSRGLQGLFEEEEEDKEIQFRKVPWTHCKDEVQMLMNGCLKCLDCCQGTDQKDRGAGTGPGMPSEPLKSTTPRDVSLPRRNVSVPRNKRWERQVQRRVTVMEDVYGR